MVQVKHRIRYPPFESAKLIAEHIPVVEYDFEVDGAVIPPFKLGNTDSWHVERIIEGDYEIDTKYHGEVPHTQFQATHQAGVISQIHHPRPR